MRFLCNTDSAISTCTNSNHHQQQPTKLTRFSYSDLESATNGFSPRALLGKGSHGAVFKAVLNNGSHSLTAAVKKPTPSVAETAQNELQVLSKIRSPRIVNLIGYSLDKLLLVVEYMPNGSLYDYLHKHDKPPGLLTRVRFALQVAKAVRAIHTLDPPVMHRDIKSSNVLIDDRENARLSDFGLAVKENLADVRVMSTPPAGTLGYLDPCYLAPGDLSTKSDVFSFGILLLEMISGRKAIDVEYSPPSIVDWALPLIKSGSYLGIVDRRIGGGVDQRVVRELGVLAARCVRSTAEKRPPVSEIVEYLKKVYRRVKVNSFPVWGSLRRRVGLVGRSRPSDDYDGSDWENGRVRLPRHGSRKSLSDRLRKVSNVESSNGGMTHVIHQTAQPRSRSRSIGSCREISKVGPDASSNTISDEINDNNKVIVKRRGQVTVKTSSGRLSKSRSMSMLNHGNKIGVDGKNRVRNPREELEVLPLLVKCNASKSSKSSKLLES